MKQAKRSQRGSRNLRLTLRGIEALRIIPIIDGYLPAYIYIDRCTEYGVQADFRMISRTGSLPMSHTIYI